MLQWAVHAVTTVQVVKHCVQMNGVGLLFRVREFTSIEHLMIM